MDNTENSTHTTDDVITAILGNIQSDAVCHFYTQSSIVFLRLDVWLPQGIEDEENRLFIEFIETYRRWLANDRRSPFILWMRDKSLGRQCYLCGLFLNGFCLPPQHGYFKAAETIWAKTLGIDNASDLIGRCAEDRYGKPVENCVRVKRAWCDDAKVINTSHLWILSMHQRACRVRNPEHAHLVFGAAYRR